MKPYEVMLRLGLALGIGLLLGIERGWRTRTLADGSRVAGVRTFAISGLLGGVAGALGTDDTGLTPGGGLLLAAALVCHTAVIVSFDRSRSRYTRDFSATSTVASLLTFLLGAYAGAGHLQGAAAAAVAAAGILTVRQELHSWLRRISLAELKSAVILLAMTAVVLPWVPDQPVAALGGLNPRHIWLLAIALALVSFLGYVAVKELGERRGLLAAAAAGGLISSTAVLLASARQAARRESPVILLLAASALATAISLGRVFTLVAVLAPTLIRGVLPPLLAAAGVALAFTWWASHPDGEGVAPLRRVARNPFRLLPTCGMALAIGILILVGERLHAAFGNAGTILGALFMGAFDVDAMTISMAKLSVQMPARYAAVAILVGVVGNTLLKIVLALIFGTARFTLGILAVTAGCVAAGALAYGLFAPA